MNPETATPQPGAASPFATEVPDTATLELLASWQRQDATSDHAEMRAAEEEVAAFKRAMNGNRAVSGEPVLYP